MTIPSPSCGHSSSGLPPPPGMDTQLSQRCVSWGLLYSCELQVAWISWIYLSLPLLLRAVMVASHLYYQVDFVTKTLSLTTTRLLIYVSVHFHIFVFQVLYWFFLNRCSSWCFFISICYPNRYKHEQEELIENVYSSSWKNKMCYAQHCWLQKRWVQGAELEVAVWPTWWWF